MYCPPVRATRATYHRTIFPVRIKPPHRCRTNWIAMQSMSSAALKCVSELWSQGDGKDSWPIVIGLLLVGNQRKHQHAYAIENWKPNAGLLAPVRQCMYVLYIRCLPWQRHTPWLVLTDNNTDREGQVGKKKISNFGINSLSLTGFQQLIGAHLPGQRDRSLEDSSPFWKKKPL